MLAWPPLIELDTHPEGWRDRPVEAPATSWETRCQLRQVRESATWKMREKRTIKGSHRESPLFVREKNAND